MLDVYFKRDSQPIDDTELMSVADAVQTHMRRVQGSRHVEPDTDYYILLAKMLFRIEQLKTVVRLFGASGG